MPDIRSLHRCATSANTKIRHVYEDPTNNSELCDNCRITFSNILFDWLASARTAFRDAEYNEMMRIIEENRQVQIRTLGMCASRLPEIQILPLDPTGQDRRTVGQAMIDARKEANRVSRLREPDNRDCVACLTVTGQGGICSDCNAARLDYNNPLLDNLFDGNNPWFTPSVIAHALDRAAANRVAAADRSGA